MESDGKKLVHSFKKQRRGRWKPPFSTIPPNPNPRMDISLKTISPNTFAPNFNNDQFPEFFLPEKHAPRKNLTIFLELLHLLISKNYSQFFANIPHIGPLRTVHTLKLSFSFFSAYLSKLLFYQVTAP